MGPSFLIARCRILAIRTAKWSAPIDVRNSISELGREFTTLPMLRSACFPSYSLNTHPFFPGVSSLGTR